MESGNSGIKKTKKRGYSIHNGPTGMDQFMQPYHVLNPSHLGRKRVVLSLIRMV